MGKNTTISIPTALYKTIETFLEKHPQYGYLSATEFIKESIRRNIDHYIQLKRDMMIKR